MNRRQLIALVPGLIPLTAGAALAAAPVKVDANTLFNDAEAPVGGNAQGDVTIIAFLDYNCPFCKKSAPDLDRIVATDGRVRLVYKDWPILTDASIYGAQMALGAKYQGQYETAHRALMAIPGRNIDKAAMLAAVKTAGIDMTRLQADIDAHADAITGLLQRNLALAEALKLEGTPIYLIGPFRFSTLDYDGFAQAVSDARAHKPG
ncbi:MAG: DsbA family protein [Ancalomicrobiaceae bacterium]|nr:DsbA family protein [Ancalomicrobiaceae bacterium]